MTKAVTPSREIDIVQVFQRRLYYACPSAHWVAVPNAAKRTRWAAQQAKREGMRKGFPDGMVLWPGGGIVFLEFKDAKGKASEDQAEWLSRLDRYGFPVALVRSADEAMAVLRACGAPVREVQA